MIRTNSSSGLVILGTEPGCGKTVVMTGIAATLREEGLKTRAVKPIALGNPEDIQSEYAFISSITRTAIDYSVQHMKMSGGLTLNQIEKAVKESSGGTESILIELPGSTVTPLVFEGMDGDGWLDVADMAKLLGFPALIVTKFGPHCFEQLVLHASYLKRHDVSVVGLVAVSVEPNVNPPVGNREASDWDIAIRNKVGAPYLGCLKHSQSINVKAQTQGNLIATTTNGLDLLPIVKALTVKAVS